MSLEDPVVITCSISGSLANREQCPAIPYTPEEYAAEARRIVDEGGVHIHIHARTPDGTPSYEVEDFPWMAHLAWKLLHSDEGALSLFDGNPFPERPPRHVRALLYRYRFAGADSDAWWERERQGVWMGPWSVDSPELLELLAIHGWGPPR